MTGMRSSSSIFAAKGDPWLSDKERATDFRWTQSDDPEKDRHTKATKAAVRAEAEALFVRKIKAKVEHTHQKDAERHARAKMIRERKLAIIRNRMNMKLRNL
jgi:hypothetical protein